MAKREYDKAEHPVLEPVPAVPCYGIYADYDANAPDTEDLLTVSTEELAKAVCEVLNEDPRKWGNMAFVDGFEWAKSFSYHKTFVEPGHEVSTSVEKAMSWVEEDEDCEESEDSDE